MVLYKKDSELNIPIYSDKIHQKTYCILSEYSFKQLVFDNAV